jgi:hypothetical protein
MSEFVVGDVVRVKSSMAARGTQDGPVVFIATGLAYSLYVAIGQPGYEAVLGYRPDEVELVSAVLTQGRTVTVAL